MTDRIYIREELRTTISSTQFAHSYVDGRIAPDETFLQGQRRLTCEEVVQQDKSVRETLNRMLDSSSDASSASRSRPDFDRRLEMFRRLVLLGHEDISSLIADNQRQAEQLQLLDRQLRESSDALEQKDRRLEQCQEQLEQGQRQWSEEQQKHDAELRRVEQDNARLRQAEEKLAGKELDIQNRERTLEQRERQAEEKLAGKELEIQNRERTLEQRERQAQEREEKLQSLGNKQGESSDDLEQLKQYQEQLEQRRRQLSEEQQKHDAELRRMEQENARLRQAQEKLVGRELDIQSRERTLEQRERQAQEREEKLQSLGSKLRESSDDLEQLKQCQEQLEQRRRQLSEEQQKHDAELRRVEQENARLRQAQEKLAGKELEIQDRERTLKQRERQAQEMLAGWELDIQGRERTLEHRERQAQEREERLRNRDQQLKSEQNSVEAARMACQEEQVKLQRDRQKLEHFQKGLWSKLRRWEPVCISYQTRQEFKDAVSKALMTFPCTSMPQLLPQKNLSHKFISQIIALGHDGNLSPNGLLAFYNAHGKYSISLKGILLTDENLFILGNKGWCKKGCQKIDYCDIEKCCSIQHEEKHSCQQKSLLGLGWVLCFILSVKFSMWIMLILGYMLWLVFLCLPTKKYCKLQSSQGTYVSLDMEKHEHFEQFFQTLIVLGNRRHQICQKLSAFWND